MDLLFDVAIIGGGINGCGCAADAALRGLKVALIEEDDLASKTSSKSTKLIHGGLRYLEYFDFAMVKKSLIERQTLLEVAPHLIKPLPLLLPLNNNIRPSWMIRAGLFLYDRLSNKNSLPKARALSRNSVPEYFTPLKREINRAFLFYDCATDDARLTLANALQARDHGAAIYTRTKLIEAVVQNGLWHLKLIHKTQPLEVRAKTIINAGGPWVEALNKILNIKNPYPMTLVKGSHFLVPQIYQGDHAYFLQHEDKRMIFVIPYHDHTMIGTTDVAVSELENEVAISPAEINYLCSVVNQYFDTSLNAKDIVYTWSGIRPLLASTGKNLKELSRDYTYFYTSSPAPGVVLCGGKLTTYRQLAEHAVDELKTIFPNLSNSVTAKVPLPGANLPGVNFMEFQTYARQAYHWLGNDLLERFLRTYGTRLQLFLKGLNRLEDLGKHFGQTLYQAEVDFLRHEEWAQSLEDILWRRTKLGLTLTPDQQQELWRYLQSPKDLA